MIITAVSIRDPNGYYLVCRQDGTLDFVLIDLDPSCKFFMVPWGAGRTCLKSTNGKFVDIHENIFLCDGVYTGVGFIFTETTLQLVDGGKYLSNVVQSNTITASDTPTILDIKAISFESFSVDAALSVPAITYSNVSVEGTYRPGREYLVLRGVNGEIDIIFSIPYSMFGERDGTVEVILNHMRDATGGIIDIDWNGKPLIRRYPSTPSNTFRAQNIGSLVLDSRASGENKLSIKLSLGYPGNYYFSDAVLIFKDSHGYVKQEHPIYALGSFSGSSYSEGTLEDTLRRGNPYLSIERPTSWFKVTFTARRELKMGDCVIKLQHGRGSARTSIDIFLNGVRIKADYRNMLIDSFATSEFSIHSQTLQQNNELVIKPKNGKYYISDASLDTVSHLPAVTRANFENYVKKWILNHRKNIAQLHNIPRNDISAWQFVREAPYWFILPFIPCALEELAVIVEYYTIMSLLFLPFEIADINNVARDFHRELISTDLPRKNALRHAYWTAILTRRFGMYFALDLTTVHEEVHVDLTIEGPFDHVTDKINNAVGSFLGSRTSRTVDLKGVIDTAWTNGELAYARDFRETPDGQTARVFWQTPLDILAKKYNVIPRFSKTEKATLKKMKVNIPNVPIIH